MAIYVYRREASDGARELANALGGVRYRALQRPIEQRVRRGDVIIGWGEAVGPVSDGVIVLNGAPLQNKFRDAVVLREAGVRTVEVSQTRPAPVPTGPPPPDPAVELWNSAQDQAEEFLGLFETPAAALRTQPILLGTAQLEDVLRRLQATLRAPAPQAPLVVQGEWLARRNNHVGGNDLLANLQPNAAEYFSRKEEFVEEFRIHSFVGKSIRAGKKVPRDDGFPGTPHTWIRSWDGGWRIVYTDITGTRGLRDLAHAAVKALGLDFGAVDIGQKANGELVVLEVNRAPGLSDGTAAKYSEAILRYVANTTAWAEAAPARRRAA
jgi:hypothetical protein